MPRSVSAASTTNSSDGTFEGTSPGRCSIASRQPALFADLLRSERVPDQVGSTDKCAELGLARETEAVPPLLEHFVLACAQDVAKGSHIAIGTELVDHPRRRAFERRAVEHASHRRASGGLRSIGVVVFGHEAHPSFATQRTAGSRRYQRRSRLESTAVNLPPPRPRKALPEPLTWAVHAMGVGDTPFVSLPDSCVSALLTL